MSLSLRFVAHSEVGRIRKNNQDAGYASPTMLLVADGMGGAAAGDLASAVAATEAARSDAHSEIFAAEGEELLERIAGMIARSNTKLTDLIENDLELDGMGTTFCGALFNGKELGLAHIGDSRCYLLRDNELTQLTHDHSWVQSLIDEGKITVEQAATHPHRSLILKVLNGQVQFEPDLSIHEAHEGDRIFFCSDGLSGLVDDDVILEVLREQDLDDAVSTLARMAYDNGGHDNITIVAADIVAADAALNDTPAVLVGSAVEVEVPRTGGASTLPTGQGYPATQPEVAVEHDATETARYAPTEVEPKRRWPGVVAVILAVALVTAGGWWAASSYVSSRYFISADDGHVTVFNGVPGNFLGIEFHSLVERTDIPVENLPRFFRSEVESYINVSSQEAAERTVGSLRDLADVCVALREERRQERENPKPSPSPSASLSPSPSPSPSAEESVPSGPGLPSDPLQTTPTATVTSTGGAQVPPILVPSTPEPNETPTLVEELATLEPSPGEEADLEDC